MPLDALLQEIVGIARPLRIVLFSQKTQPDGSPRSVKLCIVIPDGQNAQAVEQRLYLDIDTELAFDALVYTAAQWEKLSHTPFSLAARALADGRVLYEA